ncbi:MAG: Holliday junction resolvase RuvX [Candidatus Wallbacteria bacterium HGW-Wallbacteria-1]|jgi:putative Holliday junction resolvase|uniref:Putative pre-16S rRNA nuclease n=1 Tax=Candidatus Wallbacteria bacterium HGW-Wallbacteria-1 TaxID=2013854 RepID=A0A2N1PT41_9BACT|nr:MAG: Holliday junction resolvase RuvX [Candidatus Wallbacteria bacterium HGW-Wallbacteria-1]
MARVMGLDIGKVRIGVALSDETRTIASPAETVPAGRNPEKAIERILAIAAEKQVSNIVIGLPLTLDNREMDSARDVRAFVEALSDKTDLPIAMVDERMTTAKCEKMLISANMRRDKRKQVIDQLAACEILTTWMARNPL